MIVKKGMKGRGAECPTRSSSSRGLRSLKKFMTKKNPKEEQTDTRGHQRRTRLRIIIQTWNNLIFTKILE